MYLCLLLMYSVLSSYYLVISSLFEFKIKKILIIEMLPLQLWGLQVVIKACMYSLNTKYMPLWYNLSVNGFISMLLIIL